MVFIDRATKINIACNVQRLLESSGSPSIRKDMADLLQHVSELDASQAEHSLSSVLLGIHLTHHASLLERLLQHSAALLGVVERGQQQQRAALAEERGRVSGGGEGDGGGKGEVGVEQLAERQRRLAAEVADLKSLPRLGQRVQVKGSFFFECEDNHVAIIYFNPLQLPNITRLSTKLYATMAGKMCNINDEPFFN